MRRITDEDRERVSQRTNRQPRKITDEDRLRGAVNKAEAYINKAIETRLNHHFDIVQNAYGQNRYGRVGNITADDVTTPETSFDTRRQWVGRGGADAPSAAMTQLGAVSQQKMEAEKVRRYNREMQDLRRYGLVSEEKPFQTATILPSEKEIAERLKPTEQDILKARRRNTAQKRADERVLQALEETDEGRRVANRDGQGAIKRNDLTVDIAERFMRSQDNSAFSAWYLQSANEADKEGLRRVMEYDPEMTEHYVENTLKPHFEQYQAEQEREKIFAAVDRVKGIENTENGLLRAIKEGWLALEGGLASGISSVGNALSWNNENSNLEFTSSIANQANINRRENDGDGTFLLEALTAVGNQVPAIAAGAATGGIGSSVVLGLQGFGNGFRQATADGADKGEAFLYGALNAAFEIGLSKALGGIESFAASSNLGGTLSNAIGSALSKVPKNLVTKPLIAAAKLAGRSAPEILEEALQGGLEPLTASAIYGKEIDWASVPETMVRDGLLGFASAVVLNLANSPAVRSQRTAQLRLSPVVQNDALMLIPKPLAQALSAAERNGVISEHLARRVGGDISAKAALDVLQPNEALGISQKTLDVVRAEVESLFTPQNNTEEADNYIPYDWRVAYLFHENPAITKNTANAIASDNKSYKTYNNFQFNGGNAVPTETRNVVLSILSRQPITGNQANKILYNPVALKAAQDFLGIDTSKLNGISEKRSALVQASKKHPVNPVVSNAPTTTNDMWKAKPTKNNNQNIVYSLTEITNAASKIFGVKPRSDNNMLSEGDSPGEYNEFTGEINLRKANNLPAFMHELGHMLDTRVGFTKNAPVGVKNEVLQNFKQKEQYDSEKWLTEGFAEFVREFMSNPDAAAESYPQTYEFVTSNLTDSMKKALVDTLIPAINRYLSASDLDRARAATKADKDKILAPKIAQKWSPAMRAWEWYDNNVGTIKEKFVVNWIDDLYGIDKAARITGSDDLMAWYKTASNSRVSIKGRIKAAVTQGLTDIDGNVIGRSLESCFETLESAIKSGANRNQVYDDFNTYLIDLRARDILSRKDPNKRHTTYGDHTINTAESAQKRIDELEKLHPEFVEAAKRVHEYLDTLLEMRVKSGLVGKKQAAAYRAANPHYVPYYREGMSSTDTTKAMTGSTRDFQGAVQSIMIETANVIRATTINDIKRGLFETITAEKDMAWFVARNNNTPQEFELSMEENDKETGLSTLEAFSRQVPNTEKDMGVWVNGSRVSYRINDKAFYTAVTSLNPNTVRSYAKVIRSINRIFTATVTGLNLPWNITSNLFRDVQTLLQNSDDWKELASNAKNYCKAIALSFKGMEKQSEDMKSFYLLGGKSGISSLNQDLSNDLRERKIRSYLKQQSRPNAVKALLAVLHPVDTISRISDAIESKPRIAAYLTALEKGKSRQEAFFEAQDITTNFGRRGAGRSLAWATSFVPFFNAGIQGLSKSYRTATGYRYDLKNQRGKKALAHNVKSAAIAVAFASIEALIGARLLWPEEDQEEAKKAWNNLSTYHKNNSWCFYIGDGEFFTIKKPRELGIIPSFVGRVIGLTILDDEEALYDFVQYSAEQLLPPLLDTLPLFIESIATGGDMKAVAGGVMSSFGVLGNLLSTAVNVDYLGNEIVPSSMSKLPAEEQYKNTTTYVAKWLNKVFPGISPIEIDYALKNLGIIHSLAAAYATDEEGNFGEKTWDFLIGDNMIKDSTYSTDVTTRFYDARTEATKKANSKNATVSDKVLRKEYDNMASFWSNFNNLRKQEPQSDTMVALSNTMLDMLREFYDRTESGNYNAVVTLLHELSADIDALNKGEKTDISETAFYPAVMPTTYNNTDLNAEQYVSYQTAYNGYYYDALAEIFADTSASPQALVKKIDKAKQNAKKQADNYIEEILNGGK